MSDRGRWRRLVPAGLLAMTVAVPLLTWSADPTTMAGETSASGAAAIRADESAAAQDGGTSGLSWTATRAVAPISRRPMPGPPVVPAGGYQVGVRHLALSRGVKRPLPTTVWYPAARSTGATPGRPATVAPGWFPLVLLSHGLYGLPQSLDPLASRWARAGFVVAAPMYPHTSKLAPKVERSDIPNQPADASYVISALLRLAGTPRDLFAGHLDARLIAAAGHSAGGYTTAGLLSSGRDDRVRAGIIMSGAGMGTAAFRGPVTPVLFLHGDADRIVSYSRGRATFNQCPWPKAFVTYFGQGHGDYLAPRHAGFEQSVASTIDFLRWALYRDGTARGRLWLDATHAGVSSADIRL